MKTFFHLRVVWWVIYFNFRTVPMTCEKKQKKINEEYFFHLRLAWWVIYFNFMGSLGQIDGPKYRLNAPSFIYLLSLYYNYYIIIIYVYYFTLKMVKLILNYFPMLYFLSLSFPLAFPILFTYLFCMLICMTNVSNLKKYIYKYY